MILNFKKLHKQFLFINTYNLSNIRVTYSGLISLIVGLITILGGFVFTIIITRNLSQYDFSTWGLIMGLFIHAMIMEPIVTYWTTREIARNQRTGFTAILTSGVFSIGGIATYLVISIFLSFESDVSFTLLLYGIILIPLMYLNKTLMKINWAWKPHVTSYAALGTSLSQIIVGLVLIEIFNLGLEGLIFTTFIAISIGIFINFFYAKEKISLNFEKKTVKKWLTLFWLPLYPHFILMFYKSDIIIFILLNHSISGLSFWTVAVLVTTQISSITLISRAVYAKLLQAKDTNLNEHFLLIFYFGIPFTSFIIIFARPILYALNPIYEFGFLIVIFLAIRMLFYSLNDILESYLLGVERVDFQENTKIKDYLTSKLFLMPSIRLIQYSIYITLLSVGLIFLINDSTSELNLLIFWSFIACITQIPTTIYFLMKTRKFVNISFDSKIIIKYLIISLVISTFYYFLTEEYLIYTENIFIFVPHLLFFVGLGIITYISITFLTDKKTRDLTRSIISEFKK